MCVSRYELSQWNILADIFMHEHWFNLIIKKHTFIISIRNYILLFIPQPSNLLLCNMLIWAWKYMTWLDCNICFLLDATFSVNMLAHLCFIVVCIIMFFLIESWSCATSNIKLKTVDDHSVGPQLLSNPCEEVERCDCPC